MKVLLIGGTQFIGPQIVKYLKLNGHDVMVYHRGKHESVLVQNVEHLHGSREELVKFVPLLHQKRFDAVIDMIALYPGDSQPIIEVFSGQIQRAVVISSCDVYAAWNKVMYNEESPESGQLITEESPLRSEYFPYKDQGGRFEKYDKILVENEYLQASANGELPSCILRLPMVYGPFDPQTRTAPFDELACKGERMLKDVSMLNSIIHRGYVENVAYAILKVVEKGIPGEVFHIGDSQTSSFKNWIEEIGKCLGIEFEFPIETNSDLEKKCPPHLILDIQKIKTICGYKEIVSPADGLARTLEYRKGILASAK